MSEIINVEISDYESILFCKKYPNFSIPKLVSDYVSSVSNLSLCDVSDIKPFIKSMLESNTLKILNEMNTSIIESIKSIPNETVLTKIN